MKARLAAAALFATVVLAPASVPAWAQVAGAQAAAPAQRVLPGSWEYRARVAIFPVSKEYRCLNAEEIEDFLFHPCTRKYRCTYPLKQVGDGRVKLDGTWVDRKQRVAKVRAEGTYTLTSLNMRANVVTIHGFPVSGSITARRIGDSCPAAAQTAAN